MDDIRGYSPPSVAEQDEYYRGLAGIPRLVARTSTDAWERPADFWRVDKKISTVTRHEIVHKWCPELRDALISTLNNSDNGRGNKLAWNVFYPIRIGAVVHNKMFRDEQHPVVLLVGLDRSENECTWEAALRVALRCRDLLRLFSINTVEVEIQETRIALHASPQSSSLASAVDWRFSQKVPPYEYEIDNECAALNGTIMPLLPFPGHAIQQEPAKKATEPSAKAGTMGVFLRLKPPGQSGSKDDTVNDEVYGLTSRHVAVANRAPLGQDIRAADDGDARPKGLLLFSGGASCAYGCFYDLKNAQVALQQVFRTTQMKYFKQPEIPSVVAEYQLQHDALGYADTWCARLHDLSDLEDDDTSERLVGSVAYSPGHAITGRGRFRDWSLVKLAETKGTANLVYLVGEVTRAAILRADQISAWQQEEPTHRSLVYEEPKLDKNGFLHIHGDAIAKKPPFEEDLRRSHLVAKRGAKSDLTFGVTNEIEAVRRTLMASPEGTADDSLVSFHLLVLDFAGGWFSKPGDSGACVFDTFGRVVGMVDAGQPTEAVERFMVKPTGDDTESLPSASALPSQSPLPEGFTELTADAALGVKEKEEKKDRERRKENEEEEEKEEKRQKRGFELYRSDVTFVTLIRDLMADIREFTGMEPAIL